MSRSIARPARTPRFVLALTRPSPIRTCKASRSGITGPKVLDFYAAFCANRATCLKAGGKDIVDLNLILNGNSNARSDKVLIRRPTFTQRDLINRLKDGGCPAFFLVMFSGLIGSVVYSRLDRAKKAQTCNPVRQVAQVVGPAERRSSRIADQVVPAFLPHDHHEMITAVRQRDQRNDGISR